METYAKRSEPTARPISARAGHGQPDMATVLQAYRNRTTQFAALTDKDDELVQGKLTAQLQEEEEETLQGKIVTQLQGFDEEEPWQQKAENRTGLPDRIKNGVESLSGYSLDAVKVYKNSPKPAQLQAYAYTQGTDIHVAPGQERYLGHEAWHVVQQMQGRVQPTTQLQGIAVNDNEGLEREADVMGEKAMTEDCATSGSCYAGNCVGNLIQRVSDVQSTKQYLPYHDPDKGLMVYQLVGETMEAWLDPQDPLRGSAPGSGGNYALYPLLNALHGVSFVKGHLLNANLGGPGLPQNLFPITTEANQAHSCLVEEPVKANFLALYRSQQILGGGGGMSVPTNAHRLHYQVNAVWNSTGDFLNNPKSQLNCYAEFVDHVSNSLATLINVTVVSDPGAAPQNGHNDDLASIGWGSMGSGARNGANAFVVGPGVLPGLWIIRGPQWDNTNTLMPAPKVYISY